MKKKNLKVLATVLMLGMVAQNIGFCAVNTQQTVSVTVPEIALLANSGNPSLGIQAPTNAGELPADVTNNATYLRYSANVAPTKERSIDVKIDKTPQAAYDLKLTIPAITAAHEGSAGEKGTAQSTIVLTTTAQDIIKSIKNCATGTTGTSGAQLQYDTNIKNMPTQLDESFTITFTLKDAQ